jgi:hypothetical protein
MLRLSVFERIVDLKKVDLLGAKDGLDLGSTPTR